MALDVEIPLSVLNNAPFLSGIDDVEFEIPEPEDIERAIATSSDLAATIRGQVAQVLRDVGGIPDGAGTLRAAIVSELQEALDELADDLEEDIEEDIEEALQDETVDITGTAIDEAELAESIAARIDSGPSDQPLVRFGSIFGALREDIVEGLVIALEEQLEDLREIPDRLDQLEESIEQQSGQQVEAGLLPDGPDLPDIDDALVDALEGLPGSDLLLDPEQFARDFFDDVSDLIVSEDSIENLQEQVEEAL